MEPVLRVWADPESSEVYSPDCRASITMGYMTINAAMFAASARTATTIEIVAERFSAAQA